MILEGEEVDDDDVGDAIIVTRAKVFPTMAMVEAAHRNKKAGLIITVSSLKF